MLAFRAVALAILARPRPELWEKARHPLRDSRRRPYLTTPNRFPDADKAMLVINMGLRYHPKSPYLHEKLGVAYEMKDGPQKAMESYEQALRLNPENKDLKEKMERIKEQ